MKEKSKIRHVLNYLYFCPILVIIIVSFSLCSNSESSNRVSKVIDTTYIDIKEYVDDSASIVEYYSDNFQIVQLYEFIEFQLDSMLNTTSYENNVFKNKQIKRVLPPFRISSTGKNFIKKYETLQLKRYKIKGEKYYTIGWGHQILPDENIANNISEAKAQQIFNSDIEKCEKSIERLVNKLDTRFVVTQGFVDALGSLVFNCGERGTENSVFFQRLKRCRYKNGIINKKDLLYSIEGIKISHVYMKGHITRRKGEYELAKK